MCVCVCDSESFKFKVVDLILEVLFKAAPRTPARVVDRELLLLSAKADANTTSV